MSIYGLSWTFGALVISGDDVNASFGLQLTFTLLNSFQGFFVFIFFCVLGKDAKEAWKELLCRGKQTSKFYPSKSNPRSKALQVQNRAQYGTNLSSDQTSSTLLRTAQSGTLQRALPRNTLTSDSSSTMGTLDRSTLRHGPRTSDSSSIISTLDRRALRQGAVPSNISEVANEIDIELTDSCQNQQLQLHSLQERGDESVVVNREQEQTETVFENINFEQLDDLTEETQQSETQTVNTTRLSTPSSGDEQSGTPSQDCDISLNESGLKRL